MKAYNYDLNGIYISTTECALDPLETELQGKDVYLLPANATFSTNPDYDETTSIPYWNGISWNIIKKILPITPSEPVVVTPTTEERNRADIDYLAIMMGVSL